MNRGSYVTGIQHLDRCRPARRATFCLIWLSLILYGCNIFEEGKEAYQVIAEPIPSVGGQVVVNGTDPVQLLANPHENWSFSHWSGDIDTTENPVQLSPTQNMRIFANFELSGHQTRIALRVSDGQFVTVLRLGRVNGATDGFDSTIDLEAPPPPPNGVLSAWIETSGMRLLHDFRNPFTQDQAWKLYLIPGNESEIEMAWELEAGSYSGEWVVSNEDRSVQFDLSSGSHATLSLVEMEVYTLTYRADF